MQKELTDIFASIGSLYTEQRELAAIWLEKPIQTSEGKKVRIDDTCYVWVENGRFVDGTGEPSHKVIATRGTLVNQFEFDVEEISTGIKTTIKL